MINKTLWVAGFWEGEGSCGYYNARRKRANGDITINRRLTVTISQVDRTPLDEIARFFGFGKVRRVINTSPMNKDKNAFIHVWMISCRSARYFLNTILPHVIGKVKRNQIIVALKADSYDR